VSRRGVGIALAFVTACISGFSVWANSHAVTRFGDATVYTTAKNAVAGLVLLAFAIPLSLTSREQLAQSTRRWPALLVIAAIGGSIPFVLFFEGLARAEATQAAFIHKTLVIWVALIAVPFLGERLGRLHIGAIALVIAGQAVLAGGAGAVAFGSGEAMILGATLLWAVEVILAKRLLAAIPVPVLAVARMTLGTVILLAWVALSGRGSELIHLTKDQWAWALLMGLFLTAYVATWYTALARAQAVDVTAVLVFGAVVTAVVARVADGVSFDALGVIFVTFGAALAAVAGRHARVRTA
jgi:drug/metabolite transporter (DMT)-like permease